MSRQFDARYIDTMDCLNIEEKPYKSNEIEFIVDLLINISKKLNIYFVLPKNKHASNFKLFDTVDLHFSFENFRFNLRPFAMYHSVIILITSSYILYINLQDLFIIHPCLVLIRSILFLLICICLFLPKKYIY
jgi:hypothetical protein